MVPLKYLSNFWRKYEMTFTDFEISLQLKWSKRCILVAGTAANQQPEFKISDTKLYVSVVTLSTRDNVKLLKNQNLILKEQLIGVNVNLKEQIKRKAGIQIF